MYIISNSTVSNQEQKGRNIYTGIFTGMTWTPMQQKFDICDLSGNTSSTGNAVIKKPDVDIYIEIKVRNLKSTTYNTTFLEVKKHDHLMNLANYPNRKAFYFVAFTDGVAYLFDLKNIKNIDQYRTKHWMPEVSLEGQTEEVLKEIYDLPLTLGKKYKY